MRETILIMVDHVDEPNNTTMTIMELNPPNFKVHSEAGFTANDIYKLLVDSK